MSVAKKTILVVTFMFLLSGCGLNSSISEEQIEIFFSCMSKLEKAEGFSALSVTDRKVYCNCYLSPDNIACSPYEQIIKKVKEEVEN